MKSRVLHFGFQPTVRIAAGGDFENRLPGGNNE